MALCKLQSEEVERWAGQGSIPFLVERNSVIRWVRLIQTVCQRLRMQHDTAHQSSDPGWGDPDRLHLKYMQSMWERAVRLSSEIILKNAFMQSRLTPATNQAAIK